MPRIASVIATLGVLLLASCVTPLHGPKPTYAVRPVSDSGGWTISTKGGGPLLETRFAGTAYEIRASIAFDEDASYTSQVKLRPAHPLRLNICGFNLRAGSMERISFDTSPIVIYENRITLVGRSLPSHQELPESQRICGRWEFDARVNDNWPGFKFQLQLGTFSSQGSVIHVPLLDVDVAYDRMFECVGVNCPIMH